MKVYCQFEEDEDLVRVWLVGEDETPNTLHGEVENESLQPTREWQIRSGAGFSVKDKLPRDNKWFTWEGSTVIEFPTELACTNYAHALGAADADMPFPPKADVYFRTEDYGNNTWSDNHILNAAIECIGIERIGAVALRLRFRVEGGKMVVPTSGNTGTYDWITDSNGRRIQDSDHHYVSSSDHET